MSTVSCHDNGNGQGQPVKLVSYIRVSTKKQEQSGLGLEAQRAAAGRHARFCNGEIIREFCEAETGKRKDRPQLLKALAHARRTGAQLVVAKVDRLARNLAFVSALMDSGVDFVCCDNPNANRLTIHILAAVAEDEARRISERTKAALAAYKARGGILGGTRPECRNLTPQSAVRGGLRAGQLARQAAKAAYADLVPDIRRMKQCGMTLRQIADALNRDGHTTRTGKLWCAGTVCRVLQRA